ncbi:hypothetical protein E2C01_027670 [Portunus trituberculatus]|uniref:Uncharacterized protein n=1 Tax=Portunus trituberculatus TaxID=210409 RepID=A0A5B7EM59_PORTR|nr:hypothetical protein [Portunus trituberculatus]
MRFSIFCGQPLYHVYTRWVSDTKTQKPYSFHGEISIVPPQIPQPAEAQCQRHLCFGGSWGGIGKIGQDTGITLSLEKLNGEVKLTAEAEGLEIRRRLTAQDSLAPCSVTPSPQPDLPTDSFEIFVRQNELPKKLPPDRDSPASKRRRLNFSSSGMNIQALFPFRPTPTLQPSSPKRSPHPFPQPHASKLVASPQSPRQAIHTTSPQPSTSRQSFHPSSPHPPFSKQPPHPSTAKITPTRQPQQHTPPQVPSHTSSSVSAHDSALEEVQQMQIKHVFTSGCGDCVTTQPVEGDGEEQAQGTAPQFLGAVVKPFIKIKVEVENPTSRFQLTPWLTADDATLFFGIKPNFKWIVGEEEELQKRIGVLLEHNSTLTLAMMKKQVKGRIDLHIVNTVLHYSYPHSETLLPKTPNPQHVGPIHPLPATSTLPQPLCPEPSLTSSLNPQSPTTLLDTPNPTSPADPLPPTSSADLLPPTSPSDPLPPTSPSDPLPPTSPSDPLPPISPSDPVPPTSPPHT